MFSITSDAELADLVHEDPESLVLVEQSPLWKGQLVWQHVDPTFTANYPEYVSRYGTLNELFMLNGFTGRLLSDHLVPVFTESCAEVLANFARWDAALPIAGLDLRTSSGKPSELFDYQRFSLNRALERLEGGRHRHDRFFFFGWSMGTGKSAISAAGALEALNRGAVDLVLAFTMRKLKLNLRDFFTSATPLRVAVVDGTKDKRAKLWADFDTQVFVNNYDKAYHDFDQIHARIVGQRVLFVFDEVEVLLTDKDKTRVRKAMDTLMAACHSTAWPMSGSIVDHSPFSYHDNYNLGSTSAATHPMGTKKSFEQRYLIEKTSKTFQNPSGRGWYTTHEYRWNHVGLQEVRHRVAHATQNARKTDPGVRENFPGITTEVVRIQLSPQDRRLYDVIKALARAAYARGESPAEHIELMRYVCNHPGALGLTRHRLGAELAAEYPDLVTGAHSAKLEVFCDQVAAIAAAGEQCIGFTKWTELSLHLVATELRRRKIGFVAHHGAMTDQAAYDAQQAHKADPAITLFWSSDAGSHGLNMQHVRYCLNYEAPYSWARLNQRMSRIDRADGELDGRTNYVYVTDDTLERRIWATCQDRMELASATMGTTETHSYGADKEDPESRDELEALLS
jgi:hypothetical protein